MVEATKRQVIDPAIVEAIFEVDVMFRRLIKPVWVPSAGRFPIFCWKDTHHLFETTLPNETTSPVEMASALAVDSMI
jgi:hypothetical protein